MRTRAGYFLLCGLLVSVCMPVGAEMPKRKPGLWEIQMRPEGAPTDITSTQCIDEKTDAEMLQRSMHGEGSQKCRHAEFKQNASGYETDYECTTGKGVKMSGHVVISGDFNSDYTVEQQMRFDPPQHGRSEMHNKAQFHYLGSCPADMKPGDMNLHGMKFNPKSFLKDGNLKDGKFNPEAMRKMLEQLKQQGRP